MKKIFIILIVGVSLGSFLFRDEIKQFVINLPILRNRISKEVQDIKREINLPPPLRVKDDYEGAILSRSGIINWTNEQRKQNGLPILSENFRLNNSARVKVEDMFTRQYFEHEAPTGEGVAELAKNAGYDYVIIGENLALGNFKNDSDLVQAWMDSPGHRANILNKRYRDIGVAVIKGIFEGKSVWLAVQHFGLSVDVCPKPDSILKNSLDDLDAHIDSIAIDLERRREELKSLKSKDRDYYNQKVDEYNKLVKQYNTLIEKLKDMTAQYNGQVDIYNKCLVN